MGTEIGSQFMVRENLKENPEVHVAGLCVEKTSRGLRLLLAQRSKMRKLFPGLIEGCGGQLAYSESFTDGVRRHFLLEMNLDVRVLEDIHCFYIIREPQEPVIPGIRFLCERVGEQEAHSTNHARVWWVTESEFKKMPGDLFIPGIKDDYTRLIEQYKNSK